jgi:2-oxoglutarate dehydrogenase E2 component (dihydrolipoamide succinyltransferase)
MAIELRVPALGESIAQATVGAWLKKEGDEVQIDEPVVEVESEKATVALPAPAAGVLRRILKQSGAEVAIGEVIGELEAGVAAAAGAPAIARVGAVGASPRAAGSAAGGASPGPSAAEQAALPPGGATPPPAAAAPSNGAPPAVSRSSVRAPPSVRRRMAETGLDPASLGVAGVVRRADVERALDARESGDATQRPAAPAQAPGRPGTAAPRERTVTMTPLRRTVARRLLEAQQSAAILTTFNELDMSRVLALREKHGPAFLEQHGVKLGFMSFFVKASVEALRAWPSVNAEIRGTEIVYKDHYDIGVAVGGGKGLVVPVLRDADQLSFAEVEQRIGELAKKARENRITMQDLEGGTFTISNGGIYGSLLSTPILNPPQSGILGLHKIERRAVPGSGDSVVVRPMMYLALSYDHRLVDGREAVSFLVRVKECVEDPERLLFQI